jgi:hypothetical protein
MARPRKPKTDPAIERQYEERMFEFSDADEDGLLRLIAGEKPTDSHRRFLWSLARLIRLYRGIKKDDDRRPAGSEIRRKLQELHAAFEDLRSKLDESILIWRATKNGPVQEIVSDSLNEEVRQKFKEAVHPVLEYWFKDVLKEDRWVRKLPREDRYFLILDTALRDISKCVEVASRPSEKEAKGGAPKKRSKQEFVQRIVRDHWQWLGTLPATSKEGPFENLVQTALDAVGYKSGNAKDVIRQAISVVKAEGPPKLKPPFI